MKVIFTVKELVKGTQFLKKQKHQKIEKIEKRSEMEMELKPNLFLMNTSNLIETRLFYVLHGMMILNKEDDTRIIINLNTSTSI